MAQEIKRPDMGAVASRYRDRFAEMRAEMDRVFDSFLGPGFFGRPSFPKMTTVERVAPEVDAHENDTQIVFEAELPGVDERDVKVTLREGVLSLKGEKKSEREERKDTYHLVERSYGSFERSFQLPKGIDDDQVKASFDKGVLRVIVPKKPEAVSAEKKIPIGKT
jgi:HSP20 family protein